MYGHVSRLRGGGRRVVYTEHGRTSDAPPTPKRRLANRVLGRMPARIFAVSNELRGYMVESGFPAARVGTIYNGIAPGPCRVPEDRREARRRLGIADGALVVATVARLDPVKDLGTLLAAFQLAARDVPGGHLVVVGDGPERAALQRLAGSLAIPATFTGTRSDVRELLPGFDILVNSSVSEGVSVTILEAMAAGLAVVATAVGGTPEVVQRDETGLLVPARSPEALAEALVGWRRTGNAGAHGRRRARPPREVLLARPDARGLPEGLPDLRSPEMCGICGAIGSRWRPRPSNPLGPPRHDGGHSPPRA